MFFASRTSARWLRAIAAVVVPATLTPLEARTISAPIADGFDCPVGKPEGVGYYVFRGFRPNGHLGEDWNGNGMGNSDLGDPVYAVADGVVVFSADVRMGWGNVVIVRHAYREPNGAMALVDSLYGHLDRRIVRRDQIVRRGQQVGTIGTAHGIYVAHLHFEMRKNLQVGMNRSKFPRDFSVYYSPRHFIAGHRKLVGGRSYAVAVDTFGTHEVAGNQPPPERTIPTRSSAPDKADDVGKKIAALNQLIDQNKKNAQSLSEEDIDSFWSRLKSKLKNGKVTNGSTDSR